MEFLKRIIDAGVSLLVLILFIPVFLVVGLIIRLSSRGPVFYRQERIGRNNQPFQIIKFRSMVPDAEKHGPALSHDQDPRVTRLGKFLRDYKIDELPQFINVLKGDMSLIGPRPEREYYINQIKEKDQRFDRILSVKPGITSLGQVRYGYARNLKEMLDRMEYDLYYVNNRSFGLDMKILFLTFLFIVSGKPRNGED